MLTKGEQKSQVLYVKLLKLLSDHVLLFVNTFVTTEVMAWVEFPSCPRIINHTTVCITHDSE